MKHRFSLVYLALIFPLLLFGQKEKYGFNHGNLVLNGFLLPGGIAYINIDNNRDPVNVTFEIIQQIHYLITKNIAFGLAGRCAMYNLENQVDDNYQYFIGPSLKYYSSGKRTKFISELNYYISNTAYLKGPDEYYTGPSIKYLEFGIGFNFLFTPHIGIEYKPTMMRALNNNKNNYLKFYPFNLNICYRIGKN